MPNPRLQNEDIETGASKAARSLAILPGKMTAAMSAKVLVKASIGIPRSIKPRLCLIKGRTRNTVRGHKGWVSPDRARPASGARGGTSKRVREVRTR